MFEKSKAKRWTKKMLRQDTSKLTPVDRSVFTHKSDEIALAALQKIPFFDKICSKFIAWFNEPLFRITDMSTKIRITEKQLPKVYNMVKNICGKLNIEMPSLFLKLDRIPNAYTYGNESATITITTGLLECMEDDELYAVLAHECGHIVCHHVLYHTMGLLLLNTGLVGASLLDNTGWITQAISIPLKLAFYHWMRCSEFSADRAAVLCCENADPVVETMMRLAGGTTHIDSEINKELFIQQANEYNEMIDESKINKAMEFFLINDSSHPLLSVRASEAVKWAESPEFTNALVTLHTVPTTPLLAETVSVDTE